MVSDGLAGDEPVDDVRDPRVALGVEDVELLDEEVR